MLSTFVFFSLFFLLSGTVHRGAEGRQVQGLGVHQLHLQTLWGPHAARARTSTVQEMRAPTSLLPTCAVCFVTFLHSHCLYTRPFGFFRPFGLVSPHEGLHRWGRTTLAQQFKTVISDSAENCLHVEWNAPVLWSWNRRCVQQLTAMSVDWEHARYLCLSPAEDAVSGLGYACFWNGRVPNKSGFFSSAKLTVFASCQRSMYSCGASDIFCFLVLQSSVLFHLTTVFCGLQRWCLFKEPFAQIVENSCRIFSCTLSMFCLLETFSFKFLLVNHAHIESQLELLLLLAAQSTQLLFWASYVYVCLYLSLCVEIIHVLHGICVWICSVTVFTLF